MYALGGASIGMAPILEMIQYQPPEEQSKPPYPVTSERVAVSDAISVASLTWVTCSYVCVCGLQARELSDEKKTIQ